VTWFPFVILTIVTWRVTRFLSLDSLIEEPRNAIEGWLLRGDTFFEGDEEWPINFWARKGVQWLRCPWCQSVWVAAGALLFYNKVHHEWYGWDWPLYWLAIAGAAMIGYRITDPGPPCLPRKPCD
jgi:hypothetical protein